MSDTAKVCLQWLTPVWLNSQQREVGTPLLKKIPEPSGSAALTDEVDDESDGGAEQQHDEQREEGGGGAHAAPHALHPLPALHRVHHRPAVHEESIGHRVHIRMNSDQGVSGHSCPASMYIGRKKTSWTQHVVDVSMVTRICLDLYQGDRAALITVETKPHLKVEDAASYNRSIYRPSGLEQEWHTSKWTTD